MTGQEAFVTPLRTTQTPEYALVTAVRPHWILLYTYYAFVFSLPFESLNIINIATLPKLLGIALAGLAVLQWRVCFRFPPPAFWWISGYVSVYALSGFAVLLTEDEILGIRGMVATRFLTLVQLMLLVWISYSLMRYRQAVKGFVAALVISCVVAAVLMVTGVAGELDAQRASVGEANPNSIASIIALGVIGLVGLRYGPDRAQSKAPRLFWVWIALLTGAIVYSGSRGAALALMIGLSVYPLSRGNVKLKIKLASVALVALVVLVWASFQVDFVRARWEKTLYEGDVAGRFEIYQTALQMFAEQPLLGWGPARHYLELGHRLGLEQRNTHNLYLWPLIETGLLGAIPFFIGLGLCWKSAWSARKTVQGLLPAAMLLFYLALAMKSNQIYDKLFWVLLAYSLASANYVPLRTGLPVYLRSRVRSTRASAAAALSRPS